MVIKISFAFMYIQLSHSNIFQDDVPKFMGMPLYGLRDVKEEKIKEDLTEEEH